MPKFTIRIAGKVYEIYANGRAKAVQAAINEHYGQPMPAKVLFVRYAAGSVVYEATTNQHGSIEAVVTQ